MCLWTWGALSLTTIPTVGAPTHQYTCWYFVYFRQNKVLLSTHWEAILIYITSSRCHLWTPTEGDVKEPTHLLQRVGNVVPGVVVWSHCSGVLLNIGLTSLQLVPLKQCPKKISDYDFERAERFEMTSFYVAVQGWLCLLCPVNLCLLKLFRGQRTFLFVLIVFSQSYFHC